VADAHRPAAPTEDAGLDPGADFRIDDPVQVLHWLRRLRDGGVPLHLVSPQGDALATQVWSIDDAHGQLSFAADADGLHLQRLAQGDEALAVGYLDHVKLQFELEQLVLVRGHGHRALRTRLPRVIWRFQRRGAYRLPLPGAQPPQARFRHPSIPDMQVDLRIVDLSAGGCALVLPPDLPELQPGTLLHGAQVELEPSTRFDATLRLQHVSAMHGGDGARLGCAFVDLEPAAQRALQRFIDRTQRRRRVLGG
jgi:c-di-GMP-binding flagellar brake protein YcgR